ncbi:hypothetical protein C4559_03130 [Candidatus Microgenomates bacterium]|nr:MAG: hypothetical protein C4559_03130 [Candidatus Microgenomates bacterium]
MKTSLKKSLPFFTSLWAAFCPLCYLAPVLIGAGAGGILASVAFFSEKLLIILVLLSIVIFFFNYTVHKNIIPVLLGITSGAIMYYARFVNYNLLLLYLGSAVMSTTAIIDLVLKRKINCLDCKKNVCLKQ